jgi:nucleoside-diphosphate-sugar epimerase
MRILVTGSRGKVGSATVDALHAAGHEVTACDLGAAVFESPPPGAPAYQQADLTDAGDAFAVVRGHDAVIHAAAIPEPTRNPPHTVFHNNLMGAFNTLEAAIRFGVPRFVNVSSETVPGFFFPERAFLPDYAPVDEDHPIRPQDPYATAKYFSELLMDAAMRRSDIRCLTIRPTWVQWEGNYERNLGPVLARSRRWGAERRPVGLHRRLRPRRLPAARRRVRARHPRGLLHRLTRQQCQPPARRPHPAPPRRCDRDPRAPPPPRRLGAVDREGGAATGLRADALVARLPERGRDAARRRPRAP